MKNILPKYFLLLILHSFVFTIITAQVPTEIDSLNLERDKRKQEDKLEEWFKVQYRIAEKQCDNLDCETIYHETTHANIWRVPKDSLEYRALANFYVYQGYLQYRTGRYNKAYETYETIFNDKKLVSAQSQSYYDLYVHQNLGNIYTMRGEYEKAETSLKLFESAANQPYQLGEANNDLGKLFESKKEYNKALAFYQKGLTVDNLPNYIRGLLSSSLLALQYKLKNYQTVIKEANKTILYLKSNANETSDWLMNTYSIIGLCHAQLGDEIASEAAFEQSFDFMKIAYEKNLHNRNIGKLYNRQGESYLLLNEYEQSLKAFQKALNTIFPSIDENNTNENPSKKILYPENTIVEALYGKAKVLSKKYALSAQVKDVELALASYDLALSAEHGLRQTYQFQPSQLISVSNVRTYSETVMDILYLAYKNTGEQKYAEKAFEISEMTKASVLKERLMNLYAKANYLPKEIQEKDWTFQQELTELYQLIAEFNHEENVYNYKKIASLNADYNTFLNSLAQEYPNYVNSKSAIQSIDVNTVFQKIVNHSKKTLVEYYCGESSQYAFVFNQKMGFQFRKLKTLNDAHFSNYYKYLYQADVANVSFEAITKGGNKIYEHYFNDLNLNWEGVEEIIIIPDGQLSYLSFGALVKNIPDIPNGAYHQLPYLALDYTFSYNYSASILLELQQQQKTYENTFLGIAPTFDNANFQKNNLDKTESEIINIAKLFGKGKTISGEIASKTQFLETANQYGILHLATHATAYDSIMREGAIYFSDDRLALQEIYNLPLSAQLAVLSACESGMGTMARGEGVMSLARAFMYQGVPSVVASLWNANDKSTNEIMLQFYKHLKDGKPKAEALKMAKENYLNTSSIKNAHPFYWSGMMMIGDNSALTSSNGSFYKWLMLGLLIACVILLMIFKKSKRFA